MIERLEAGAPFPVMTVPRLGGGQLALGEPEGSHDWQLIAVYRGKHCPLCTRFLTELNESLPELNALGVDVIAVSGDPEVKAQEQCGPLDLKYEVGYDLSIKQMQELGLFISHPRSPEETDQPFAEPGTFIVNGQGLLQVVSLSNIPFVRPSLPSLIMGLGFIRDPKNNYPIRGTWSEA